MESLSTSPYMLFSREQWAALRDSEPMTLTYEELLTLQGIDHELSIDEVEDIYLPLSRLLSYYVNARSGRQSVLMKFLKQKPMKIPFIISIAGSVSVGKSTTARVLQALLSRWKENTRVALVATDGFLYPNAVLEEKGIMLKKGFPQSYDIKTLLQFVIDIKSGKHRIQVPKYSHLVYDIIPDEYETIDQPDILILEGLNVLQSGMDYPNEKPRIFVSDFVDFSIYVDADEEKLEEWYISRFMKFRQGAFANPNSYFHSYAKLEEKEAARTAKTIWREINRKNLRKNILPTRERASLILHKGESHAVDYVRLRK
ncbi:type I pantothenate kinase [Dysgonomonas sp. Marseille-P4677]|uniref:type I pantothenate kinase n=1 Tax=Dysgonomonas sp. Marseille-P4677 TaxID=2364790 RepID=UPI0019143D1D|nr:type I pantothenate kinase [Dysgonomonas sp. Marseille-P4677]MBK5719336.1 type I pantothenate kinase [Dysgonomonas sp. Marseille-P4677]